MLIATITALMMLFGGGVDSPYIIPKADKLVLAEVSDKERKGEIKDLIKTYETTWKAFKKWEKKFQKDYKNAFVDITVDKEGLESKLLEYQTQQIALNNDLIPIRLDIMEVLTDEEWNSVMNKVDINASKTSKKKDKKALKAEIKQLKKLANLRENISSSVGSSGNEQEVLESYDLFVEKLTDITYKDQDLFSDIINSISSKNASEEELSRIMDSFVQYKNQLSIETVELREELRTILSEVEWVKVQKDIIKLM